MQCSRCHCFMAKEHLYDLFENDSQLYMGGWRWGYRCTGCSRVMESAIDQDETAEESVALGIVPGPAPAQTSAGSRYLIQPSLQMF